MISLHKWARIILPVLLGVCSTGASACGGDDTLEVTICGNLQVPNEVDSLRIVLADENLRPVRSGVIRLYNRSLVLDASVDEDASIDAGATSDAGVMDGGTDAGDGGGMDASLPDASLPDASAEDAGMDSDVADAGNGDAGSEDLEGVISLPVSITLPRPSGPGWVEVKVLQSGVQVTGAFRRVDDFARLDSVEMVVTLDCLPVDCPAGQTCIEGRCELAPGPRGEPSCIGQPAPRDAGIDASEGDGGASDSGADDAAMGGEADAGADA